MNGTSGFSAGGGKLCRARLAGKAIHARIRGRRLKAEGRKLRTQDSELQIPRIPPFPPVSPVSPVPHVSHAYRFLHEQRHQFGTGAWILLRTHDLITLSTGISTKRGNVADTIFMPKSRFRFAADAILESS